MGEWASAKSHNCQCRELSGSCIPVGIFSQVWLDAIYFLSVLKLNFVHANPKIRVHNGSDTVAIAPSNYAFRGTDCPRANINNYYQKDSKNI